MAASTYQLLRAALCLVTGLLIAACAAHAPEFPVYGTPIDVQRLAGEWWGDYAGERGYRRRGTISLRLEAGENHAHGTVRMVPEGSSEPYWRYRPDGDSPRPAPREPVALLTIRFVSASRNTVSGTLDEYWDPDRRTMATSTFVGRFGDDAIQGTFTTLYADGAGPVSGRWKVRRRR